VLVRLTAEGFTELEGHRGYRVAPVSATDLRDVVKNRQLLECEALRLSIELGDEHWKAQLVSGPLPVLAHGSRAHRSADGGR
jgi:DNA-binding GntR family transcriptional regulator